MNELQEILPPQVKVDHNPPSRTTSILTPHGKITAYFVGRTVKIAASIGLLVAIAATYHFRARVGFGVFGPIGFGVMVWAIATIAISSILNFAPYLALKRRLTGVLSYHSHRGRQRPSQ
jgi:hypothetical protein